MDLSNYQMWEIPPECTEVGNYSDHSDSGQEVVQLTIVKQGELLDSKRLECFQRMREDARTLKGTICPRVWDNVMCWADTPAGTTVCQQCPGYINNFKTTQFASRTCLTNGVWGSNPDLNVTSPNGWTNFSACFSTSQHTPATDTTENVPSVIVEHITEMRIMYNIGYGLSLVSLILAFLVMVYFRKLHCSRNTIHLNLFASFMLRAGISLIRDNFMVGGVGFAGDITVNDTTGKMVFTDGPHWECRLFSTVFNYTIAASYMWIFMEAVFLHVLIHVNVLSERLRVVWYMVIGWSIPLVFVITWAVTRLLFDNYLCWNTHRRLTGLVWIIHGPIMLTVLINILFFISIIRTLYTKLSASKSLDNKRHRYRRMARSILLLIPVFGVYYVLFTIPLQRFSETVAFVMLFIEMFFNSYQGFFIAVVLCFTNAEVRTEVRRAWTQSRLRSGSLVSNMSRLNSQHLRHNTMESCCNGNNVKPNARIGYISQPAANGDNHTTEEQKVKGQGDKDECTPFIVSQKTAGTYSPSDRLCVTVVPTN